MYEWTKCYILFCSCAASTWMMRRQPYCARTPITLQLIGGEETEWWSQSVYGDDQEAMMVRGHWANLARMPTEVTPLLFLKWHRGIFNDRESGPRFNVSSEGRCFLTVVSPSLYWGVRTHTDHRVSTPAGLTNTSSNSNLVFPGVSHPGTDQA